MAERFGGRYSPQGAAGGPAAPPVLAVVRPRGLWRATILFLSAFLFLIPAFGDAPRDMLLGLAAGGCVILSAWLTREGLKATAQDGIKWLDAQIAGREFVAGDALSLADVMLFAFLDFGASVGQPVDPANTNIQSWYERMKSRPGATAN